jgi:hypothetical protein
MEKKELLKKIDEIGERTNPIFVKCVKESIQDGDYKQASLSLYAVSELKDCPTEAKELAKELGDLYVGFKLKEVREKAPSDRVSAKISLSELESDMKERGMCAPPEYEETKKFVYGLAPEQNAADEKYMEELSRKKTREYNDKSVRDAKNMVRNGELLYCKPEKIAGIVETARIVAEKLEFPLPPEYPENGDWKNVWKGEALEYIKECVELAQELSRTDDGKAAARESLSYAKNYASRFDLEMPPGYGELEERFGGVEEFKAPDYGLDSVEERPGETAEEAEVRIARRRELVWKAKRHFALDDIIALRSGEKSEEDVENAVKTLRNFKLSSKVDGRPLPPEYYVLKKLAGWKDEEEEKPPAEPVIFPDDIPKGLEKDDERKIVRGMEKYTAILKAMSGSDYVGGTSDPYVLHAVRAHLEWAKAYERASGKSLPSGYREFERLLEETEVKFRKEDKESASGKTVEEGNQPRVITHDETYGLRKELESSGHPKHKEALEEFRNGHYGTAARLIDVAAESDNVHIPAELLRPLYEEAIRDMLNGALAFENDPALLRGRLEDVKKYVSRVAELPEDLSALYEFLCKKAGC